MRIDSQALTRASGAARPPHPDLSPDPELPEDTRLWAALQAVGGGTWGGCVYDPDAIIATLQAGLARQTSEVVGTSGRLPT